MKSPFHQSELPNSCWDTEENTFPPSLSSSPFRPGRGSLPQDVLRPGAAVRSDAGNWPRRVRLPGEVSALLRAGVRLGRALLREPLRGLPHRLPAEETHLRGAQQGLLLQRYRQQHTVAAGWLKKYTLKLKNCCMVFSQTCFHLC